MDNNFFCGCYSVNYTAFMEMGRFDEIKHENAREYKHFGRHAVFHCNVNCSMLFIME